MSLEFLIRRVSKSLVNCNTSWLYSFSDLIFISSSSILSFVSSFEKTTTKMLIKMCSSVNKQCLKIKYRFEKFGMLSFEILKFDHVLVFTLRDLLAHDRLGGFDGGKTDRMSRLLMHRWIMMLLLLLLLLSTVVFTGIYITLFTKQTKKQTSN